MKVDILAIGVHPDDVELGCGGTLIASIAQGKKVAILDLTKGELGTRGTPHTRMQEAQAAAQVMGVHYRETLDLADGFFERTEENIRKIITIIRKYQPNIVLCNALEDRHPDHGRSGRLESDACFLSGLRKIETELNGVIQQPWRPSFVYHYIQDRIIEPDFVFDISDSFDKKLEAILCFKTQFNTTDESEPTTYISTPLFFESVKARALMMGKRIGTTYGEGFVSEKDLGIKDFNVLITGG